MQDSGYAGCPVTPIESCDGKLIDAKRIGGALHHGRVGALANVLGAGIERDDTCWIDADMHG